MPELVNTLAVKSTYIAAPNWEKSTVMYKVKLSTQREKCVVKIRHHRLRVTSCMIYMPAKS